MSGFDIRFSGRGQLGCLVAELASAIAIGRTIEAQARVSGGINLSFSQHQYSPPFSIALGRNDAKEFHCGYFFVLLLIGGHEQGVVWRVGNLRGGGFLRY